MILVILEKYTQYQAFKEARFLNIKEKNGFKVGEYNSEEIVFIPLSGHIFEIDKDRVALEVDTLIPPAKKHYPKIKNSEKANLHKELEKIKKNFLSDISTIIIGTDPDIEGCLIASDIISYYFKDIKYSCDIVFMDISNTSPKALQKSFIKAIETKQNHLDWEKMAFIGAMRRDFSFVGNITTYSINNFFKKIQKDGKSVYYTVGTQQLRALHLVVKRYLEHIGVDKSTHYRIKVHTVQNGTFDVMLDKDFDTTNKDEIEKIAKKVQNGFFTVKKIKKTIKTEKSPEWLDGSEVGSIVAKEQKVSINKVFASKTSIMQTMYQPKGLITYIRGEALGKMPIENLEQYKSIARDIAKYYNSSVVDLDIKKSYLWREEDSEEIINHTPCTLADSIEIDKYDGIERAVLDTVAKQILATFSPDCEVYDVKVLGEKDGVKLYSQDSHTKSLGWREIYEEKPKTFSKNIHKLNDGDTIEIDRVEIEDYKKKPKPLYTEATLMKDLKRKKIGAESTFGSFVKLILDDGRGYANLEKGKIIPTKKAIHLIEKTPEEIRNIIDAFNKGLTEKYIKGEIDENQFYNLRDKLSIMFFDNLYKMFTENSSSFAQFYSTSKYKNDNNKTYSNSDKFKKGSCPKCKKDLFWYDNTVKCSDKSCDFVIFKTSTKFYKYILKNEEIEELLSSKQIKKTVYIEKNGFEKKVTIKLLDKKSKYNSYIEIIEL